MEALSQGNSASFSCIESPSYEDYVRNGKQTVGCGNTFAATLYIISFVVVIVIVFMKLFIAIVLQAFSETAGKDGKFMNS